MGCPAQRNARMKQMCARLSNPKEAKREGASAERQWQEVVLPNWCGEGIGCEHVG
jgi:hypothetical protein